MLLRGLAKAASPALAYFDASSSAEKADPEDQVPLLPLTTAAAVTRPSSPSAGHRRRPSRGRRVALSVAGGLLLLGLVFRLHIACLFSLLNVYVSWHGAAPELAISAWRDDGFDLSFESYSVDQHDEVEPLVPSVMHQIYLGHPVEEIPADWQAARQTCLDLHPGWTHILWDDAKARDLLETHYPWAVESFYAYPYNIQRADALRYYILHHFGGVFLDLDLQCRRALGPLRRFPSVLIDASPAGVGNSFLMASKHHGFMEQLVEQLPAYNRNWLSKYVTVMFSTGPMFVSSQVLAYGPDSLRVEDVRVLADPAHRLSGATETPLFRHLGSSSWHGNDAFVLGHIKAFFAHLFGLDRHSASEADDGATARRP